MLAFRDNSKYKATEMKSVILRVPVISPKIWRKKKNHATLAPQTKCLEASTQLKDATCASKTNSSISPRPEKTVVAFLNATKVARQDFMVAKKIWRDIKKNADKLCAPGQKPFLILDKAPGNVPRSRKPN